MSVQWIRFIYTIIYRLISSVFNKRNIITLPFNFFINFAPVLIWLNLFNYAKLIPNSIRPNIHSKLAFLSDAFLFGDWFHELNFQYNSNKLTQLSFVTSSTFFTFILVLFPIAIWFYIYHVRKVQFNLIEWYDHIFHFENPSNLKRLRLIIFPYFIPFISFIALNIMHLFSEQSPQNFTTAKDLTAWTSYVILHVTAPILTTVYLYVFHAPGMIKCFAFTLGLQNLCGIFTHLLIPTASPWFTHMYGINDTEHVSYDQEGFAAGLVRVDTHLGTHLNTNGFHKSPIVFGAVPSLHSAIAFQCFLFIMTRASTLKHRFVTTSTPTDQHSPSLSVSESTSSLSDDNEDATTPTFEMATFTKDLEDISTRTTTTASSNYPLRYIQLYDYEISMSNNWKFKLFNKGLFPKILVSSYILLQWWATMYLDHHYRFDLFIGMLYSLVAFIVMNVLYIQPHILKNWLDLRLGEKEDINNEARTYGMRVFQGTKFEWFFDPLS
ncbi:inositolphosphotransferase 1 [Monosporozyma servazzii]